MNDDQEFLESLADMPLCKIESMYGPTTAKAVQNYFIENPTEKFRKIVDNYGQNGSKNVLH